MDDIVYKPISKNPTAYLENTINSKMKNSPLDTKTTHAKRKIMQIPKLYGLPKIHKPDIPMRLIVYAKNSSTQEMEKHNQLPRRWIPT